MIRTPNFREVMKQDGLEVRELVVVNPARVTVVIHNGETLVEVTPMSGVVSDGTEAYYRGRTTRGVEALTNGVNRKVSVEEISAEVDEIKRQSDRLLYGKDK